MNRIVSTLAIFLLALSTVNSHARTWLILPDGTGDAPTIQAGIDSSVIGDSVVLGCGTYYEANLQMKSGVDLLSDSGDPECAIVDANGQAHVLRCGAVDNTTQVRGLTLRGAENDGNGGGVLCYSNCEVVIVDCIITDNHAGWGGGIGMDCSASPTIESCLIYGNSAYYPYQSAGAGGGVFTSCSEGATIVDCVISGNSARGGGGIASDIWSVVQVVDCIIVGNEALAGGAVQCGDGSVFTIEGSTISENRALGGGGFDCWSDASIILIGSILWGNCGENVANEVYFRDPTGTFSVLCSDVDSSGFAGGGGLVWEGGSLSGDPQFCDPEPCENAPTILGDYTLMSTSPCLDAPGCGLIGALGEGCPGPTSVEHTSWGSVKSLFR